MESFSICVYPPPQPSPVTPIWGGRVLLGFDDFLGAAQAFPRLIEYVSREF